MWVLVWKWRSSASASVGPPSPLWELLVVCGVIFVCCSGGWCHERFGGALQVVVMRRLDWKNVMFALRSWVVLGRVLPCLLGSISSSHYFLYSTFLLWSASNLAYFSISAYRARWVWYLLRDRMLIGLGAILQCIFWLPCPRRSWEFESSSGHTSRSNCRVVLCHREGIGTCLWRLSQFSWSPRCLVQFESEVVPAYYDWPW